MNIEVRVPSLEGVESVTITYWHFQEGDSVAEGADLVEVATEKASFNLPSPASGRLISREVREGDVAQVGDVIAVMEK